MKWISLIILIFFVTVARANECSLSLQSVNFGQHETLQGNVVTSNGIIFINCTSGLTYVISIDKGLHASSFNPRLLKRDGGTETVAYNLFKDVANLNVWGDGTGVSQTYSGSGAAIEQSIDVYARVLEGQDVTPGNYTDSVLVTVSW